MTYTLQWVHQTDRWSYHASCSYLWFYSWGSPYICHRQTYRCWQWLHWQMMYPAKGESLALPNWKRKLRCNFLDSRLMKWVSPSMHVTACLRHSSLQYLGTYLRQRWKSAIAALYTWINRPWFTLFSQPMTLNLLQCNRLTSKPLIVDIVPYEHIDSCYLYLCNMYCFCKNKLESINFRKMV